MARHPMRAQDTPHLLAQWPMWTWAGSLQAGRGRALSPSPHPGTKEGPPFSPSFQARGNQCLVLLGCLDYPVPASRVLGGQAPRFPRRTLLPVTGQGGLLPDSGPRKGPCLPCFLVSMGPLLMGRPGAPHPPSSAAPEEWHLLSLKSARTCMRRAGTSRRWCTVSCLARQPSLRGPSEPQVQVAEAGYPSSVADRGGLCCPSSRDPGEARLHLSLGLREDPHLATLWAHGGPIRASLRDPEARHQPSYQVPGGCSRSRLRSRG